MISASTELKNKIFNSCTLLANITITLNDNTNIVIDNTGIMDGGISISQSLSSKTQFQVGTVNSSKLTLKLVNFDDRYADVDFTDAQIVVRIGAELANTTEYVNKGVYYVDSQTFTGGVVNIVAYDKIADFDTNYNGATIETAINLIQGIATRYSLTLVTTNMNNPSISITIPNSDTTYTDREILSYICQVTGNNAYIDNLGRLVIKWYDFSKIANFNYIAAHQEDTTEIQAGLFEDMEDVDVFVQAGIFTNISSSSANNPLIVTTIFDIPKIDREDVVITGVKVSDMAGNGNLIGTDNYIIEVNNNPLFAGNETAYGTLLANVVVGNTFRALTLRTVKNPLIEAGDVAIVNYKNKVYATVLTNVEFSINSNLKLTCGAESPGANTAVKNSEAAKAYKAAVEKTERLVTQYDAAMQSLTNLMAMSFGVYKIEEVLSDGSVIFYMASKPTLAESYGTSVWKMTANTFTVTDDYQGDNTVWRAGVDSQGNFVVNILSAIGINFDWARGGILSLGGYNNTNGVLNVYDENNIQIGYWNNTGIHLNKGSISINSNFSVDDSGYLTATDATVQGTITADEGNIGLWTIEPNSGETKGGLVYENDDPGEITTVKYLYMKVGNTTYGYDVLNFSVSDGIEVYHTTSLEVTPNRASSVKYGTVAASQNGHGIEIYSDGSNGCIGWVRNAISSGPVKVLATNGASTDLGQSTTAYVNGVRVVCQSSQPAAVSGKTIVWIQT